MVEAITKRKKKTPPPVNDLSPYSGPWTAVHASHLLRRTTFGLKPIDVEVFVKRGLTLSVLELVSALDANPSPPVNNYNFDLSGWSSFPQKIFDKYIAPGDTWIDSEKYLEEWRFISFKSWWIDLMLNQKRSIREKMTLFLHNTLPTSFETYADARLIYRNNQLLRTYALGNYKELIRKVTIDPFMLIYLNGAENYKKSPNENYARELQELFTIGKNTGTAYTENDIKAAAKVLSGHTLDWGSSMFNYYFNYDHHDTDDKQFSEYYGNKIIKGRSGKEGANELDELLDMIFSKEDVAINVCRKLYRFFVYYEIPPEVELNIIIPLAKKFRDSGYNLKTAIVTLISSKHFYDEALIGSMIKSPLDYVLGLINTLGVKFEDQNISSTYENYKFGYVNSHQILFANVDPQFQSIYKPPSVAGFVPYHQEPTYYRGWLTADTVKTRENIVYHLLKENSYWSTYLYDTSGKVIKDNKGNDIFSFVAEFDPFKFIKSFKNPSNPDSIINELIQRLFSKPISNEDKIYLKSFLLETNLDNAYWTNLWNEYTNSPNNTNSYLVRIKITNLVINMAISAEYQTS